MLPAATSLKKQGANKGATTAFLITTPESGVDSITVTYALLDPFMTVIRPVAAFVSGMIAGSIENGFFWKKDPASIDLLNNNRSISPEPQMSKKEIGGLAKAYEGIRYGIVDVWGDIALWFFTGLLIAGLITALVPEEFLAAWLGGGIVSMLMMLLAGIPLYICATASTPIAAALILKGVSPGAALVFLLVGPATNITSLTVLFNLLGKRSTINYLLVISIVAVAFGLGLDGIYHLFNIEPKAIVGEAGKIVPYWVKLTGAVFILIISLPHLLRKRAGGCSSEKPVVVQSGGIPTMTEINKKQSFAEPLSKEK